MGEDKVIARRCAALTAAAVVLAGCSAEPAEPAGANVVTTSKKSTPTVPAPADGVDVAACADGTCEILVSGPAEIPTPAGTYSVVSIAADSVNMRVMASDGSGTVLDLRPGGATEANGQGVTVVALSGGQAVLSFAPA